MSFIVAVAASILPGVVDVEPIRGSELVDCADYWFHNEYELVSESGCVSMPISEIDSYISAYARLLISSGWRWNSGGGNQYWLCKPQGAGLTIAGYPAERPTSSDWSLASDIGVLRFFPTDRKCFTPDSP